MSVKMRFAVLGAVTVVVLLGWFSFAWRPASSELGRVKADLTTTQGQVAQLRSELARLQALGRRAPELRAEAARFKAALPSAPALPDFIREVQRAANAAAIQFLTVGPSLPTPLQAAAAASPASPAPSPAPSVTPPVAARSTGLESISVSISATGTFSAMKDFVHRLETLERALRVNQFSVSAGSAGSSGTSASTSGGVLSLSMTVSIFEMPQAPAPGASPVPAPSVG